MGFLKQTYGMFLVIVLAAYCFQTTFARSRTFVEQEDSDSVSQSVTPQKTTEFDVHAYKRVECDFLEATSDEVCEKHCIPRGYTYGICVNHSCSCV